MSNLVLNDKAITPFIAQPEPLKTSYDLDKLLQEVFRNEAQRLKLSPERYEYSCINKLYKADKNFDTHYLIYDPGSGILRGMIGNVLGEKMKQHGVDLGKIFEETAFSFSDVLFKVPGMDVAGYGHFHAFFNVINPHLRKHNLVVGYLRQETDTSFRHGFYDHVGLIEGIPGKGIGNITAGDVEMYPVEEIEENKLYSVDIKGGKLYAAPMATCNWCFVGLEDMTPKELLAAPAEDIPIRDCLTDTFHFLNGVTPHYMKRQLSNGLWRIRNGGTGTG